MAAGVGAADRRSLWPPLRGDLTGKFSMPGIPGFPELSWHVFTQPADGAGLALTATATAPGLEVLFEITAPAGETSGSWRILRAQIDAASWWRLGVAQSGIRTLADDFEFAGRLTISGAGKWQGAAASGALKLTLAAGRAGSVAQNWTATGLTLEADLAVAALRTEVRNAQLRVDTIQAAGLTAQKLMIDLTATTEGRFAVTRAEFAAFGGRIALAPFTIDPAAPSVKSTADFSGLGIGDLAALVPQALKEAQGQVAGRLAVNWTLKSGFGPGDGSLSVSSAMPVIIRLTSSPGLLTGNSPPRIALIPSYLGALSRWVSLENPAHSLLQRIELGQAPLAVESLALQLYPDGAGGARSAAVKVVARTTGVGDVVEQVTFSVNVSGPLDQVLRLGMDNRAKVRLQTTK